MREIKRFLLHIKENSKIMILYQVAMASLSILAVGILIFEYSSNLDALEINIFYILDEVVLLVFAADYFIRFYLADNKKLFFKKNIIDLISIIPFNSIFQAARVLRVTNISKLLKIYRMLVNSYLT